MSIPELVKNLGKFGAMAIRQYPGEFTCRSRACKALVHEFRPLDMYMCVWR